MGHIQRKQEAIPVSFSRDQEPLRVCVEKALDQYFADLEGHPPDHLHQMVMREVEAPLLARVMRYANGNQTRAACILGINRATLRKKLRQYDLD